MASFSDIARRQTRLRGRDLGRLEGGGFSDVVKEKSISKLARLKQKAQDVKTKPKPEMPLEAPEQAQALSSKPAPTVPPKPILQVSPPVAAEPQPGLLRPGQEPAGAITQEGGFGGLGQGDPATGPTPSMSMADAVGRGGMGWGEALARGAAVLGSVVPNPVTGPVTPLSVLGTFKGVHTQGKAFEDAAKGKAQLEQAEQGPFSFAPVDEAIGGLGNVSAAPPAPAGTPGQVVRDHGDLESGGWAGLDWWTRRFSRARPGR